MLCIAVGFKISADVEVTERKFVDDDGSPCRTIKIVVTELLNVKRDTIGSIQEFFLKFRRLETGASLTERPCQCPTLSERNVGNRMT
jgi:hypothetical protein